jgi:hypothetical protein
MIAWFHILTHSPSSLTGYYKILQDKMKYPIQPLVKTTTLSSTEIGQVVPEIKHAGRQSLPPC